jgi:Lar family restriction alleviation protein
MTAATLKPCPFCGVDLNLDVQELSTEVWAVTCNNCGTCGPMPADIEDFGVKQSFDEAVRAWNTRGVCE